MITRRKFVRSVALGTVAAAAGPGLLAGALAPAASSPNAKAAEDIFDLIGPRGPLALASDLGCPMVEDALRGDSASRVAVVEGEGRWTPAGVMVDNGEAILGCPSLPLPGNRSTYERVEFSVDSPRSTIELRLVTTYKPVQGRMLFPLRALWTEGTFVLRGLGDELIAGDPHRVVFTPRPGEWHAMELITFQKSVHARISGCPTLLRLPDRLRFIPGEPGVRLAPAPRSKVRARNWLVTAVGPRAVLLGAIGDSITAGYWNGPEADDYVDIATRALGQRYVLNTGSGGATTAQDRARFPYEIAPFQPRLVWIESGTNDLTPGGKAVEIYANQMATAGLVRWGGRAVLSTVPPSRLHGPAAREERRKLNDLIRRGALPYVDRARICESPGDGGQKMRADFDSGDGTHPNRRGAAAIAAAAYAVFRRLV